MSAAIEHRRIHTSSPHWSTRSDEELLLTYRATAERGAFEELVYRYERELYSYLRRYLGDAVLAEDAFQTTFLQVHLKQEHFEEGRRFRPWLYTIATNQAIDLQRRNQRHRAVSLDRRGRNEQADGDAGSMIDLVMSREPDANLNLEGEERRAWVREAVNRLPDPLKRALVLIYYQGLKYREAAEILDIPVGTVKSRLHTAIFKLNEAWTKSPLTES
jgi:RNA polymerase sigma-70 factor (ECF subfamily)